MINKIFNEERKKIIIGVSILSFVIIFWYAISFIIGGILMIQLTVINDPLQLFNYLYIPLFNIAHSLLDVQYLVQVNFSGYVAVLFMIIGGFSWVEILYILVLFALAVFYIFDKKNNAISSFALLFNMIILCIFLVCTAYFGKLAFDVFYHVNIDLATALHTASKLCIILGMMIIIVSIWVFYRFYQRHIFNRIIKKYD